MESSTLSRRSFLANTSLAALGLYGRNLFGLAPGSPVTVNTPSGMLRGEQSAGVSVFRGVPFAEAPIGPLRFRPPMKMKRWKGERNATRFAAAAMQEGTLGVEHSENCLYLNLWAPQGKGPFPVYVWIHGGGFTGGRAFEPLFDGTALAAAGIICITVAYRLGVFGFLDLEPLLGASYSGSANNALRDLIAALEWVQENVSAFGGDTSRVTVAGESAGAKLSDTLLGIPAAQPLFHQVISESGGAERVWSRADSAVVTHGFGEEWRSQAGNEIANLSKAPAGELIEAQQRFIKQWPQHFPLRVETDGSLLPQLPVKTIAAGSSRGKRLLIGTNRDESAAFLGPHPEHDPRPVDLGNLTVGRFSEVFRRYPEIYPQMSPEQLRIRAVTAEEYWIPSIRVADAHIKGGGSAWMYRLDFAESSGLLRGYAFHALDTKLVWDRPSAHVENATAEAELARQMHHAWIAFIRGEIPGGNGLPIWPEYRSDRRPTMVFNTRNLVEMAPQEAELRLWDGVL
jgi:para-nitrobenzyl esterase